MSTPTPQKRTTAIDALAHLTEDGRGHRLRDHLESVGALAKRHADAFDSGDWGFLAGLWHDLGKYATDFQAYIRKANGFEAHIETVPGRVDHSSAGAVHAVQKFGWRALPLALTIAGHHAGLADVHAELRPRLAEKEGRLRNAMEGGAPADLLAQTLPSLPATLGGGGSKEARLRRHEMWVRFLFSALVDADFLDTEAFYNAELAGQRGGGPSIHGLLDKLDRYVDRLAAEASRLHGDTLVNRARAAVLRACRERATDAPGLFSLTVPTGGGKTLSAMAFALAHAAHHDLQRVIVVIPYTSIIEQNAKVYRDALGNEAVVEHHSALDPDDPKSAQQSSETKGK